MNTKMPSQQDPLALVADDDEDQRRILERWLTSEGYEVQAFRDGYSCVEALGRVLPDVVCLDLHMPGLTGLEALQRIRESNPRVPVVILTADSDVDRVVEAMRLGAYDYLVKPLSRTKLVTTIKNAEEHGRLKLKVAQLESETKGSGFEGLVGESVSLRAMMREIEKVAPSELSVVIHGESGTGKELVAGALHRRSARGDGRFVAINCAAIPETLQESELFGHEKGAFTGAHTRRIGRFEEAHRGTLFLDEVAELTPQLQAKLLRVLQERTFRRLGGSQELKSDFRLVAATHRNLRADVRAGLFREDLFYRISVFELEVPALRDRGGDLTLLVDHFLEQEAPKGQAMQIAPEALALLLAHDWPGNVRELRNALQRAAVVAREGVVRPQDLPPTLRAEVAREPTPSSVAIQEDPPESFESSQPALRAEVEDHQTLAEIERQAIEQAFERHAGNRTEMARQLGIGRTTLYRKLKQYQLE